MVQPRLILPSESSVSSMMTAWARMFSTSATVELGLLVLGLVVFAVFGKVAEGARLLDLLGYFLLTRRLQIKKFLLQLFEAERTDLEFFCHD